MITYISTRLEIFGRMIRRMFCRHQWEKIGYRQEIKNNLRYPIRTYQCGKCGAIRFTDGRDDPYEKTASASPKRR